MCILEIEGKTVLLFLNISSDFFFSLNFSFAFCIFDALLLCHEACFVASISICNEKTMNKMEKGKENKIDQQSKNGMKEKKEKKERRAAQIRREKKMLGKACVSIT